MSELLSTITGGGGGFVPNEYSAKQTGAANLTTGNIVTVTPATGERVRLSALYADNVSFDKSGTTVTFGSRVVVDSKTLTANDTEVDDEFMIGQSSSAGGRLNAGLVQPILGEPNEELKIDISVSSDGDFVYSFETGV